MKTIIRIGLCLVMFAYLAVPARAFVFSDIPATVQRVAAALQVAQKKITDAKNWVDVSVALSTHAC